MSKYIAKLPKELPSILFIIIMTLLTLSLSFMVSLFLLTVIIPGTAGYQLTPTQETFAFLASFIYAVIVTLGTPTTFFERLFKKLVKKTQNA